MYAMIATRPNIVFASRISWYMANIGKAGGLNPIIQSFVVVYVLILAIVAPILTKESRNMWHGIFGGGRNAKNKPTTKTLEALEANSKKEELD